MRHPYDRRVFFVLERDQFFSLNDIHALVQADQLSAFDAVFDVDGERYYTGDIVSGRTPMWAVSAKHDLLLHDLPIPSAEDIALVDELACEDDFIEMPAEPKTRSVSSFLAREPRIAHLISLQMQSVG